MVTSFWSLYKHATLVQPYDGDNPHSILVMDNCSIHHVQPVLETLRDMGILTLFTTIQSRYEPD